MSFVNIGYTIIPFDDLNELITFSNANSITDERINKLERNLFLYKANQESGIPSDLVLGKLKAILEYKGEHPPLEEFEEDFDLNAHKETLYEKETSIQRLIPKQGYVTIIIQKLTTFRKNIEQLKLRYPDVAKFFENMHQVAKSLRVHIDFFHENSELQKYMQPFEAELGDVYWDINHFEINYHANNFIEITPQIIDYLQNKSAKIEIGVNLPSDKYISLGSSNITLLPLIANQKGITGDYELNTGELISGIFGLIMTFNKEKKIDTGISSKGLSSLDKKHYKFYLNIGEVINFIEYKDSYFSDSSPEGLLYLTFEIDNETKRSIYYNINKKNNIYELEDNNYIMDIESSSTIFRKPIEIKIVEKMNPKFEDRVVGLVNLDLSKVLKSQLRNENFYHKSVYALVYDIQSGKPVKMRLGLKILVVGTDDSKDLRKLNNYISLIQNNTVDKKSRSLFAKDPQRTGMISRNTFQELVKTVKH